MSRLIVCVFVILFSSTTFAEVISLDCTGKDDNEEKTIHYELDIDKETNLSDVTIVETGGKWTGLKTNMAPSTITIAGDEQVYQISRKDLSFAHEISMTYSYALRQGQCKKVDRANDNQI